MSTFEWPPTGSGSGVAIYANFAAFPASAPNGTLAVDGSTHIVYEYNSTAVAWEPIASNTAYLDALAAAGAATSIGALDSQAPNANGLALVAHVLSTQSADLTHPGVVNNAAQSFSGVKTFASPPNLSSLTASLPLQLDASKNVISSAIDLASAEVTGVLPPAKGGAAPVGGIFYVDNLRTDPYTPDGSETLPFLTIQDGINAIAALGPSSFGTVMVASGGREYIENVTLNSSSLVGVTLRTVTNAVIRPASGYSIQSTLNNTQLGSLIVDGFGLPGGINLVGDGAGNDFLTSIGSFSNCGISADITFSSLGQPTLYNCDIQGNVSFYNVVNGEIIEGRALQGSVSVQTDGAGVLPDGFGGTTLFLENVVVTGGGLTIDSGSYVQMRRGTRFGSSGGTLTIQSGGELEVYTSFIRSAIVNDAGGTYTNHSGFYQGSFTNNGTYTNQQTAPQIAYDPTTPADWSVVPTEVGEALDTLASVKGTVSGVSVVSANGFTGTVATSTTTPAITLATSITGILQGNGTAISAASTTGSGNVVLATSPTLTTPALGTPSALVGTNITGTASGLSIGGSAATLSATLPINTGGTGAVTAALAFSALSPMTSTGDIIYSSGGTTAARRAIGSTGDVLTVAGGVPTWAAPATSPVSRMAIFAASGTWTKPATVTATTVVKITVQGGGGGGGTGVDSGGVTNGGGGGGGGGGTAIKWVDGASLGATESVGVAGAVSASVDGNTSNFGALCSASGGTKGTNGAGSSSGAGGTAGVGIGGDINFSGDDGAPGGQATINLTVGSGGNGGGSFLGGGGAGAPGGGSDIAGFPGHNYGGGGGGGAGTGSGGTGSQGFVMLEWIG